ncbi:MAG: hypothetical protein H7288_11370 [Kineosporiaceae bacterium]|nr:hypothetical protein [Aeromicrobium sp.]
MSLLDDALYLVDLNDRDLTAVAIASKWGLGNSTVKDHRKKIALTAAEATPHTATIEASSDGSRSVTAVRSRPITLDDARAWIRSSGDQPDDYTLSIKSIAYGVDMFSNKMSATPKHGIKTERTEYGIDPVGILAQLRLESSITVGPYTFEIDGESSAFCITINDVQLGQSYNGGSAATIANFYRFIELAKERIYELRLIGRKLEGLVVVIGGDLVEGCVIYPNQSFSLDLDRKQQIEGVVALILHALDSLAPLFEWVKVLACKGNHGEHRINGKMTTLADNDDTHCVEMAKLALARDPNMQHIEWIIAEEEAAVWTEVHGWTLVTTHGDVFAKGVSGATTERKAHAWFKNMAAAVKRFGRIGQADVLITHHFHHGEGKDWGDTLWRQTPSQDRGSPGFSQASGTYSEPGMLTWVMTPTSRYKDEAVLV